MCNLISSSLRSEEEGGLVSDLNMSEDQTFLLHEAFFDAVLLNFIIF